MNGGVNTDILSQSLQPDIIWHGFQPLRHLNGSAEIWLKFWQLLLTAIPDLTRRPYVFIGGQIERSDWVCGTGDFIGTFANDWLIDTFAIPASGSSAHFRFGEFCKIENGQIVEIRIIIDLPDLLRQTGINLLPPNYGRDIWTPGPFGGDGVLLEAKTPSNLKNSSNSSKR